MANERLQELQRLDAELGTLKWTGSDEGWEQAIAAVRMHINERCMELVHRYMPDVVDSVLLAQATTERVGTA